MQWKRMSARDCPLLTKEVTYKKKGGKSKNKYFLFDKVCVRIEHAGNKRSIITSLRYQLGPSISNLVEQTIMFIHVHQT